MAIVQASLAEEILTRQERAVIRGVYRASQLAEAISTLDKVTNCVAETIDSKGTSPNATVSSFNTARTNIRGFLLNAMVGALVTTKVPANSGAKGNPSKPAAE